MNLIMDKISRENLVQNLNLVNSRIKEAKKKKFEYKTDERYLTGWAIISQIEDYKELVEVLAYLKSQMANTAGAAEDLGIDLSTLDEEDQPTVPTLCGYPVTEWIADVKTRKAELDNIATIEKLTKAKALLENNLSEDDRFNIQMAQVADLMGGNLAETEAEAKSEEIA